MIEVNNLTKEVQRLHRSRQHISFDVKRKRNIWFTRTKRCRKKHNNKNANHISQANRRHSQNWRIRHSKTRQQSQATRLVLVSEKMIMYDRLTAKEKLEVFW